jgi:hypothetical protein
MEYSMRDYATPARDLRRERLAGNWGGASEQIGRRWEELGMEILRRRMESNSLPSENGYRPRIAVPLADDPELQLALSRSGLPSPDVIMVLQDEQGERVLQALDFKWNLEYASYAQIRAEALQALIEKGVPPLQSLLQESLGQEPIALPTTDGLLSSPILPVNHWFLGSDQNMKQEYPIEAQEVIFEEVDPRAFFEPLPGWEMANQLAGADRSQTRLRSLEGAEHYYRIGAGLQGAVAQLRVSIFVRKPPAVTVEEAMVWLKAKVRPPSSMSFLQMAERLMSARSQLHTRLRSLTRSPYRFADLAETLKSRGRPLPEREEGLPPQEKERWGELLRRVGSQHKELIYRTGLKLVEAGLSDADALTRLEGESRRFAAQARSHAEKLIDAALQG